MFLSLMYLHELNWDTGRSVESRGEGKGFGRTGEVSRLDGNGEAFALSGKPKTSEDICFGEIGEVF